ncbi:uncharacterized protein LOC103706586 [Phoenix dactylifera]|uniref:Uncharacterized protein LOC103706586 n=1 Tax=Phoenix dactylifera TaxID=42345 RepID=A0A8B7C046_PHODC|nr:uncharacterized protein LOC103706586 [Phoenix dactylifera]
MPQVDIENLVCGGDRKVACETLAEAGGDPDFPAESFEVRIGDEIEWADLNAVYDREDSTKGGTNPKSNHTNPRPLAASNSQRFSANLKAKPPIIGLPGKIHNSGYDGRRAHRPPHVQIFPKKAAGGGGGGEGRKSPVPELEPGSPKVSCFGKVSSDRERKRCQRECPGAVAAEEEREERECWRVFAAIFWRGGGDRAAPEEVKGEEEKKEITVPSKNIPAPAGRAPESAARGIGGMMRFASGRRAASWGAEAEVEEHAARSVAMDRVGSWGQQSGSVEGGK